MSSAQIPNLLSTLRAQRAEVPRRGPRRTHHQHPPNEDPPPPKDSDLTVQQTDTDAAGSRLSCVELGYLDDPFARVFSTSQQSARRMPIINRGTYVRTVGIDRLVDDFLQGNGRRQVVSLGAGTDTRPFRLLQKLGGKRKRDLVYHEFDFGTTTKTKVEAIQRSSVIPSMLRSESSEPDSSHPGDELSGDGTSLCSPSYTLSSLDLRSLATDNPPALEQVDPSIPTLILSECCLTYLIPETSSAILKHLLSILSPHVDIEIILYEPIHPDDAFGKTMISNLASRHISMPGLVAFKTIEEHCRRLATCGFGRQEGWTISEAWEKWISPEEKARLRRLEGLDEEEEWLLLAGHYALIRGVREARRDLTSPPSSEHGIRPR